MKNSFGRKVMDELKKNFLGRIADDNIVDEPDYLENHHDIGKLVELEHDIEKALLRYQSSRRRQPSNDAGLRLY